MTQNETTTDLTEKDWWRIREAVRVVATDPKEPERYREWYGETLAKLDALIGTDGDAKP